MLTTDVAAHGRFELAVNARACGPRLGGDTQKVIRAVKAGEWEPRRRRHRDRRRHRAAARGVHRAAGPGGDAARSTATAALPGSTGLVVLDTAVTPELAAEGIARDVVRVVQQARRDAGLDVSDRITLTLDGAGARCSTRCARTRSSSPARCWPPR